MMGNIHHLPKYKLDLTKHFRIYFGENLWTGNAMEAVTDSLN